MGKNDINNRDYLRRKEVLTSFFSNKEYKLMTKKQICSFFNIPKNDIDILDEIVLVFKDDKITLDKYAQILKVGFKNSSLTKIPGTQDQVMMGDIDRSRSHKVKAIFIIGLNDGVFPSVRKD